MRKRDKLLDQNHGLLNFMLHGADTVRSCHPSGRNLVNPMQHRSMLQRLTVLRTSKCAVSSRLKDTQHFYTLKEINIISTKDHAVLMVLLILHSMMDILMLKMMLKSHLKITNH